MYKLVLHKNLNTEKWSKFSRDLQILMIANELNRLINAIDADLNFETLHEGIERIFELVDLTINTQDGNFRREFLKWREIFAEIYLLNEAELKKSSDLIKQFYRVLMLTNGKTAELL